MATINSLNNETRNNFNFNKFKAIAMACDNGDTLPTTPSIGQWFLHTPTGRNVLMQYDGSTWVNILNSGTSALYIDYTNGTDDQSHGYGVTTSAYKTIQYCINQISGIFSGAITINLSSESHYTTSDTTCDIYGKIATGTFGITIQGSKTTQVANATATSGSRTSLTNTGASLAAECTASASSTASTLVATGNVFAAGDVGKLVFNSTDTKTRRITGYTSATTVTVDSAINDSWDNDKFHICTYADMFVRITAGTGSGQILPIQWHTNTVITLGGWADAALDNTSQYVIESCDAIVTGATSVAPTTGAYTAFNLNNTGALVRLSQILIKYALLGINSFSPCTITLSQVGVSNIAVTLVVGGGGTYYYIGGCYFDLKSVAGSGLTLIGATAFPLRTLFRAFNGATYQNLAAIKSSSYCFFQQCILWGAKDIATGCLGFTTRASCFLVTYDCTLSYCSTARDIQNGITYWGPGTVTLTGNGTDGTPTAATYCSTFV